MKSRFRWLGVVLLISLPIFMIVIVVLRDFVRERIVVPVLFIAWMSGLIFNSIPHVYFLFGLVIIGLMLAIGSLRFLLSVVHLPTEPPKTAEEPTRYQFWLKRCQKLNSSAFFLTSLGIELRRLILMVVAYQEHRDMWELERDLINKEFDVPLEIYDLISQRELGVNTEERSLWSFLLERLRGQMQPADTEEGQSLQNRLYQIVSYLENRLEVEHDRRDA
jgi:hypothetical protein